MNTLRIGILLATASTMLACSAPANDSVANSSQLSGGGSSNIDLHDCRLYIEKAGVDYAAHNDAIDLYLRTQDGFDSTIDSIEFYGVQSYTEDGESSSKDVALYVDQDASDGSAWHIQLATTADNDVATSTPDQHGVFGVTTVNGTHYWLRSGDGGDFYINDQLFQNLAQSQQQLGVPEANATRAPSPDNAIYTNGDFPYLDPNGC